ncbi:MAG: phosphatidylglycerol lysyltransferase domain-containing protein [Candidatus Sericytochromatia bacterium]
MAEPWLPLSWRQVSERDSLQVETIALPGSRARWLAFGDVPAHYGPLLLAADLQAQTQGRPFVLRGCHPLLLRYLPPGEALLSGREALLDLQGPHTARKSLRELARRGRRHGQIKAYTPGQERARIGAFLERVRHTYRAPLAWLYRTGLPESERLWVLEAPDGRIWGLISVIRSGPTSWHTELLARDPEAPVGVMEALITGIFEALRDEGQRYWSLGEVPFYPLVPPSDLKTQALTQVGQGIDFAYSAAGLYRFKQKFQPLWRPVALYGTPGLPWHVLAGMFWRCNCHQLVWKQARERLLTALPWHGHR